MKRLLPVLALVLLVGELGTIQQDYDPPATTIATAATVHTFGTNGALTVRACDDKFGPTESWALPISGSCLTSYGTGGTDPGAIVQFGFQDASQPDWVNVTLGVNGFGGSTAEFCLTYATIPGSAIGLITSNSAYCLWSIRVTEGASNCLATFGYFGGASSSQTFAKTGVGGSTCKAAFAVNNHWGSATATWYREGTSVGTFGFISVQTQSNGFGVNLRTQSPTAGGGLPYGVLDQLEITNVQIPEQVPEVQPPSEFDAGLMAFITGLGFITPASQFFFSLILIGVATVSGGVALKFMAPGRMKIVIVASIAVLVGAFCAILQLFDLWMFVLAAVLAGTVIKGAGEVRNTWREIRSTIANRARTIDQDGQVVQETRQTAPEPATTAPAPDGDD